MKFMHSAFVFHKCTVNICVFKGCTFLTNSFMALQMMSNMLKEVPLRRTTSSQTKHLKVLIVSGCRLSFAAWYLDKCVRNAHCVLNVHGQLLIETWLRVPMPKCCVLQSVMLK